MKFCCETHLEDAVVDVANVNLTTVFTHSKHTRQILSRECCQQCTAVKVKQFGHHLFTNQYVTLIGRYTARHVAFSAHKVVERFDNASRTHIDNALLSTQ